MSPSKPMPESAASGKPDTTDDLLRSRGVLERAGLGRAIEIDDLWDAFTDEDDPDAPASHSGVEKWLSDATGDGRYLILDEVARGGMGRVVRAIDQDICRPVAMKVLLEGGDEEKRARFAEEAQITGQLEHPNIVPIHELGLNDDGHLFFTMKMVGGRSLGAMLDALREQPLAGEPRNSLPEMLHALVHACNAVRYAHSRGVVHRDLKPDNIMIGEYGEILVMDWGLAKIGATRACRRRDALKAGVTHVEPEPMTPPERLMQHSDSLDEQDVRSFRHDSTLMVTRDGTVAGTPAYMSPEQARAELDRVDERSDVYGLGAILYEILTLSPPVSGRTEEEVLEAVKTGLIRPPEERAPARAIPAPLSRIAMKALRYAQEDRYQTAEEFHSELALYLEGLTQAARGEPVWQEVADTRLRYVRWAVGVAAVLLAALGTAFWLTYARNTALEQDLARETRQREEAEATREAALERLDALERSGVVIYP